MSSISPIVNVTRRCLLLVATCALVHPPLTAQTNAPSKPIRARQPKAMTQSDVQFGRGGERLPPAVADMRLAILEAVELGDIEELRGAIALNELPPDFGEPSGIDPITHFKSISGDAAGREILAVLGQLLDGGWASVPGGNDIENSRLFVWPRFAVMALDQLSPAQEVDLYRLVSPAEVRTMRAAKRWTWWRLTIGADGVWHGFTREP